MLYNPVTGDTYNVSEWNYDYSTRTYNITIDNSQTINVTYGDEYVTIKEGDTITNIYYGGGSVTPTDPEACQHNYTDTVTTAPSCTAPGVKTSTCSKCSKSTTTSIPAKGHTWAIRESVQTSYDDTGQLLQEGYTIYKCSVCGEEYKSTGTTGPPPSGGGNTPGESTGVFSGVLGLLLDFISFFWNMFTGFIDQGIKGFLKSLTDSTSDVFGILNPFSWGYS